MPRSGVGKTRAMLPWSLEAPGMIPSGCGEPEDGPDYLKGSCAVRSEAEGSSITIRGGEGGALLFDVRDSAGAVLVTCGPFATICRLEAALAAMGAAAGLPWQSAHEHSEETVLRVGRRKIRLQGKLTESVVQLALQAVADGRIIDERPPARRRHDLTGRRCDLSDG